MPVEPAAKARQIRRMKLTTRILQQYGYTEGCDGCRHRQAGLEESRNHSEECRKRIEEAMEGDESGRQALAEQHDRIGHRLAEHMERSVQGDAREESKLVSQKGPEASNARAGDSNPRAQAEREGDGEFADADRAPSSIPPRAHSMGDAEMVNPRAS